MGARRGWAAGRPEMFGRLMPKPRRPVLGGMRQQPEGLSASPPKCPVTGPAACAQGTRARHPHLSLRVNLIALSWEQPNHAWLRLTLLSLHPLGCSTWHPLVSLRRISFALESTGKNTDFIERGQFRSCTTSLNAPRFLSPGLLPPPAHTLPASQL